MPCYQPLVRALDSKGKQIFYKKEDKYVQYSCYEEVNTVPCRQCIGCRMRKRLDWTIRGVNELQSSESASFVTLTYNPTSIPDDWSLSVVEAQKWLKRLRKRLSKDGIRIRYYLCGEYGEEYGRPHYHAIIFGYDFPDKELYKQSMNGHNYYTSELLSKSWKRGFCTVADVNLTTIAYVAKYAMKKITGDMAEEHYTRPNRNTGELHLVTPEFQLASRNPALGRSWFEQYETDVFPEDCVVFEGKKFPVPRYYMDLLEKQNPDMYEQVQFQRQTALLEPDAYKTCQELERIERVKLLQQEKFLFERNNEL